MPGAGGDDARLVGRADEIAVLDAALEGVAQGHGGLVVISGEAGIGKTALLGYALQAAEARHCSVLAARAREVELSRPLAAVADLVHNHPDGDLGGVASALRAGAGFAMADRALVVADELVDALERRALRGGVVVAVEDVHWADPGTLAVLRGVARSVPAQAALLVLTVRPTPVRRDVQLTMDDLAEVGAHHLHLAALPETAVADLVRSRFGAPPSEALGRQLAGCGGNPFYLLTLLAALEQEGALDTTAGVVDLRGPIDAVPGAARDSLERHLRFLPPPTSRLLRVASLLGESFTAKELAAVTDRAVSDLLEQLDVAVHAGLIVDTGDRWTFRHDLVRQTLEEQLAPHARKALHREAAAALERIGAPTAIVARHLSLGAEAGDRVAIDGLRRAASEALRSSIPIGVELLRAALDLTGPTDPERVQLTTELLDPLNAAGRAEEAEVLARSVLGAPMPVEVEVGIIHALASTRYGRGDVAGAIAAMAPLLARDDVVGAPRSMLHSATAVFSLLQLDLGAMATHAEAARRAAAGTGDHYAAGLAANTTAMAFLAQGRPAQAAAHARDARSHAVAGDVHGWLAYNPPFTLALVALERDELGHVADLLGSGRRELEACGNVSWLVQYAAIDALAPYLAGALDRTEDACRAAQSAPLEQGPRYQLGVPSALLSLVAHRRGDLAAAARHADQAEQHFVEHGPQLGIDLAWLASALVKEDGGDAAGAFEVLQLAWALTGPLHAFVSMRLLAPDLARLAAGRDPALAAEVATEAAEAARRNPVPSAQGTAALVRALADDDPDRAVEAVALLDRSPRRLATADAATQAVRLLRAAGRRDDAAPLYEHARQRYEAAGARGDLDRLRRAAGLRRRAAAARPTFGWESLTPTERAVVTLLHDGLTNRQIGDALGISRRTVETHLSHVFAKVGLSTRVQLAAEAATRR